MTVAGQTRKSNESTRLNDTNNAEGLSQRTTSVNMKDIIGKGIANYKI